jgi:hypothetical protein
MDEISLPKNIPPGGYANKKDRGWVRLGTSWRKSVDIQVGGGGLTRKS